MSQINVNTIANASGTSALTIDTNGTIQMPQKPAWRIGLNATQSSTETGGVGELVTFDNTSTDNRFIQGDLTLSGGILTCNVAGIYQVNANIRIDDVSSGYVVTRILVNNADSNQSESYSINGSPPSNYITVNAVDVFKLNAGDNLRVRVASSADNSWSIAIQSIFSGHMVG